MKTLLWGLGALAVLTRCAPAQHLAPTPAAAPLTLRVDATRPLQTIENFAASDAWACQFVGTWPDARREAIADLLFSTEAGTNGQPRGIGLSLWRFNLGAGSTQQGEQSGIPDEWHRAESFQNPADGTYDWTRLAGQRWFVQAAHQRGVQQFLAFLNSPPVRLTTNGRAFASEGRSNLPAANVGPLATYLATSLEGLQRTTGVQFNYVSPVNEPQWDWSDNKQEGTPFSNTEVAAITKALAPQLAARQLTTKIMVAEAAKLDYLFSPADKPGRGDQVLAFFGDKAAPTYLGSTPGVAPVLAAHSYFTTSPLASAITTRQQVAASIGSVPGLRFWQSEYCILGDNAGEINGNPRDLSITPALYMARTIHLDLTVANATAWQWWLAVSPYDYKDGLVYIDKNKTDGSFRTSKMLWALGNYSRFLRPGAVRLTAQLVGAVAGSPLLASSYRSAAGQQLITVVVNDSDAAAVVALAATGGTLGAGQTYVTSATTDLAPGAAVAAGQPLQVAPRSITTLVSAWR